MKNTETASAAYQEAYASTMKINADYRERIKKNTLRLVEKYPLNCLDISEAFVDSAKDSPGVDLGLGD